MVGVAWVSPAVAEDRTDGISRPEEETEAGSFEALSERYSQMLRWIEQQELAAFEEKVERFAEVVAFERSLREQSDEEEERAFEEQFERSMRVRAFLSRLVEGRRHQRIAVPPCLAEEPEEWSK
jgi:hypothetical protein